MVERRRVRTIRSQVYQIMRDEICNGVYPPGSWLQEVDLAEHLGVSRSPVREALRQLVSDGLLIEIPNKGVFVKEFTVQDIDEIFDMRIMLERYGIQNSRKNMTSAKLQKFIEVLSHLESAFRQGNIEEYTKWDSDLHTLIVTMGGNSLVNSTYERVESMNQQFRILSFMSHRRFNESFDEHRQIVHALIMGNTKTADMVNSHHLELACSAIKEQLEKRGSAVNEEAENEEK